MDSYCVLTKEKYYPIYLDELRKKSKEDFKADYLKRFQSGKVGIKWKTYQNTSACQSDFVEWLKNDSVYQHAVDNTSLDDEQFAIAYDSYCESEKQKAEKNEIVEKINQYIYNAFLSKKNCDNFLNKIINRMDSGLYHYFTSSSVVMHESIFDEFYMGRTYLCYNYMFDFCSNYKGYISSLIRRSNFKDISLDKIVNRYLTNCKIIKQNLSLCNDEKLFRPVYDFVNSKADSIISQFSEKYSLDYVIDLMNSQNPHYKGTFDKYMQFEERNRIISAGIIKAIPQNYIDLFPLARQMHRKFHLHIGGTNSGKTYSSMQALKESNSGVYLGPLRLLAAEQYTRLNREGFSCSLLTGEEKKIIPEAKYVSSTIEMLNFSTHYNVAVIDEAQMITDSYRGGGWTNAILGVLADDVHVCAAPEAEELLTKIILSCGDEIEVEHHERNTPLIFENDKFEFSKRGIQKGDALIVFSKRSVHAVANDLKRFGIKASIIYGNLPYDVRQNEADKFANGITDVVVTTDAIGLGMNLPIKRVVFLEVSKFDGTSVRDLNPEEIKQIAGRAGRFGIFNEGYVNCFERKGFVKRCLNEVLEPISYAYLRFPEFLTSIDGPLSYIYIKWEEMKVNEGFRKADVTHEKKLCEIAEKYTDDKKLIYDFVTIPFDDENGMLLHLWEKMLIAKLNGQHINMCDESYVYNEGIKNMSLQRLEEAYKVEDLLFYYNEKFEDSLESAYIMEEKEEISKAIIDMLDKQKIPARKCKECGKILPWHFRYNICEACHQRQFSFDYW